MPTSRVRARRLDDVSVPEPVTDPGILEGYLEDASGSPPGPVDGLLRPCNEAEAATFLRRTEGEGRTILPQAARSSLTGGATPRGETIVSVESMADVGALEVHAGGARIPVGPGVRLSDLQRELAGRGYYYPPVPTYQEAMVGGTVSTNAGGPATFKYGVTRSWVHGLRVVLFNGDLLVLERGEIRARPGDVFEIELTDGRTRRVPVPTYELPPLKKISAGYHAADPLDLVDLFVGSEGTLGLITGAVLDLVPRPAAEMTGLTFLEDTAAALALTAELRSAATRAREAPDAGRLPDVRAIEFMDGSSLDLLRRHGDASRLRVPLPDDAGVAILFEVELSSETSNDRAQEALAAFLEGETTSAEPALSELFRILGQHDALDRLELAFPEDAARASALREFREAVPTRVNELLAERRREDADLKKVGGDLIVPFEELPGMIRAYEDSFSRRGLEYAVWGHLSDGNLHPNVLPSHSREVAHGLEALLELGDEAARRGGCPLSEHGVGRNPVKQEMLRRFLGDAAVASMRAVKKGIDPPRRFAPGVLFPTSA